MSENSENKLKIIRPQKGFQEKFVRSNVDFVVGGAAMVWQIFRCITDGGRTFS